MARKRRAAVILLCTALAALAGCDGDAPAPDLLIISMDTVRRDHLTPYGYARETTPVLASFAESASVFDNAFAQDTRTNPSHASMFTGLYPHIHGSQANSRLLRPDRVTLAAILSGAGYATGGFVSGVTMKSRMTGLDRGFELWDDAFDGARRDGQDTMARALAWLERVDPRRPCFLFVHLYDAHGPYLPPPGYRDLFRSAERGPRITSVPAYQQLVDESGPLDRLNDYVDRYDAMLRYVDESIGRLLRAERAREAVVVVLSDHGETLGERFHVLDHGGQVFDEQTRIPLLLRAPGLRPRRVAVPVETIDLLPTVLELLGLPAEAGQGLSLVPWLRGEPAAPREHVFSSARAVSARHGDRGYRLDIDRCIRSIRSAQFKLIEYPALDGGDRYELYDLANDPRELFDLAAREPETVRRLRSLLGQWAEGDVGDAGPSPHLDPETYERLRSLGYLG